MATILDEVAELSVPVTIGGQRKKVRLKEAAVLKLGERAARGEAAASREFIASVSKREAERQAAEAQRHLTANEEAIFRRLEARMEERARCQIMAQDQGTRK